MAAGNDAVEMGDVETGCGWIAVVVDKRLERRVESCSGGNCSGKRSSNSAGQALINSET